MLSLGSCERGINSKTKLKGCHSVFWGEEQFWKCRSFWTQQFPAIQRWKRINREKMTVFQSSKPQNSTKASQGGFKMHWANIDKYKSWLWRWRFQIVALWLLVAWPWWDQNKSYQVHLSRDSKIGKGDLLKQTYLSLLCHCRQNA